jgi:hypothetical protein
MFPAAVFALERLDDNVNRALKPEVEAAAPKS